MKDSRVVWLVDGSAHTVPKMLIIIMYSRCEVMWP